MELHEKQGTERGLLLQRAADGSHVVAHRLELVRMVVSIVFGVTAIASTVWPHIAAGVGVASATWTLLSFAVLGVWSQRETSAAALAQESFDTWLYGLPWSPFAGDREPPEEELRRKARRSTLAVERMRTWYPDVSGIASPYATLVCQRENLSWDWRLRRRCAGFLNGAIIVWVSVGIAVGLIGDLTVRQVVIRWFVPSMSVLLLAAQQARGHREIAADKEQLAARVRAELDAAAADPLDTDEEARVWQVCRSVQDGLFRLRKRSERVPGWLYERFRDRDEEDMRETAASIRSRLTR